MHGKIARKLFLATLILSAPFAITHAYDYNKVITRGFDWRIKPILHFDVYYYDAEGEALLPYAERYLESAYGKVNAYLPLNPSERFPFFLYNTHNEFEQTNITDIGEGTGGVTEAFKNRFLISHSGSMRELEYLITHEFTHEAEFYYLFSGFWRSVRLLKFIFYPNWLMEGLAEYSTGDIDATTREMYIRDAALSGKLLPVEQLHSFNHVLPHQVTLGYKESNELIRYIVDEYGEEKLPLLLESYRNYFDADSVLYEVLGTNLHTLDRKFREYTEDKYAGLSKGLKEPEEYGKPLTKPLLFPSFDQDAVFIPGGNSAAYVTDARGSREIYVLDTVTGKKKLIYSITRGSRIEYVGAGGGGLSITPDGRYLAFNGEEGQKDYLFIHDLKKGKTSRYSPGTDTVSSPFVSADGGTVYFSGMKDGFSDIYSYSLKNGALERLTSGPFDDTDSALSLDGKTLIYSAERLSPAGRLEYDLIKMDLSSRTSETIALIKGDERNPAFSPDGSKVYFVSDSDGINDLYSLDINSRAVERLTQVIGGNFHPEISPDGRNLMFSSYRRGEMHLYIMPSAKTLADLPAAGTSAGKPVIDTPAAGTYDVGASTAPAKNYRFKPGVDLFYPALFYSSLDGLFLATYWQASDFLGDHQLSSMFSYASGSEYMDYTLTYGMLRFRPKFYFQFSGLEYYWDAQDKIRKLENSQTVVTVYPLTRFQRVEMALTTIARRQTDKDLPEWEYRSRENVAGAAFVWDVTQGPYLEATSGWGFKVMGEFSDRVVGGDYLYQNYMLETWKFFPLGYEHAIGWRTFTGESMDENAGWFYTGGDGRVRGYPANEDYVSHKVFVNNLEWRFPIVRNINYHMWYMFPDFFFKTFYGAIFVDAGYAWNSDDEIEDMTLESWKGSYGFSLRLHTFILQSYPLLLNFQLARRMDGPTAFFYLSLGSTF